MGPQVQSKTEGLPIFRAQNWGRVLARVWFFGALRLRPQAIASWQWNNFWEAQAPPGRRIVHINIDETSVKLAPTVRAGAVARVPGEKLRHLLLREQKASLRLRRSAVTLMAFRVRRRRGAG